MTRFQNVCKRLEEKTAGTNNYVTLTKNTDARHNGKYAIINLVTNNIDCVSFKTLKEVEREFNL